MCFKCSTDLSVPIYFPCCFNYTVLGSILTLDLASIPRHFVLIYAEVEILFYFVLFGIECVGKYKCIELQQLTNYRPKCSRKIMMSQPYCLLVRKPNGSIRICIDARPLNEAIKRES